MKYSKSELCYIWIDSFLGLEYKHKQQLYNYIDGKSDIKNIIERSREYIVSAVGENSYNTIRNSATGEYLNYLLKGFEDRGIVAVTYISEDYPVSLKDLPVPPFVLYAKGNVKLLNEKLFGIVGSRKSLPLSIKLAENYAKELIGAKYVLVTGIAEGVDSAVLKTAVDNGGKTISVIAGGFDNIYPKSNQDLLSKVVESGLAISEHPPQTVPRPFHFPVRNRIIAGLSKGVLIVSGAMKSGTLYTAEYAEEYGKDLFAIPYSAGISSGAGCNDLIKRGAYLTDSPEDILSFYGENNEKRKETYTDAEREILRALSDGELHIEKLSSALKKNAFEITPILSILEIKGVVVKSGNVYGLTRKYSEE
ncbi:MAG: DNA-processing protein DprA [Clostridia bacterium]|nr:DNA-processing protein DprA [Clostridia bacterium]